FEQRIDQRLAINADIGVVGLGKDAANQRVTVRMGAGGAQCQQHIARLDTAAVEYAVFFHNADAETGQIVILAVVHAGHFRGFAADQRTAGQLAALADTLNHAGGGIDIKFAGGVVVEEKQRLGATDDQVVDTHRHQVDADSVVVVVVHGQAQLGANAIR